MARPKAPTAPAPTPPAAAPVPVVHAVGDVFTFAGYTGEATADENRNLSEGEYLQVTSVYPLGDDGIQWYGVSNLEMLEGEAEDAPPREAVLAQAELIELTPEQEAYVAETFGGTTESPEAAGAETDSEAAAGDPAAATGPKKPRKTVAKKITAFSNLANALEANTDIVAYAKRLASTQNQTSFDLAEALLVIKEGKTYTAIKDPEGVEYSSEKKGDFERFVEEYLEISYRKALYWMSNAKTLRKIGKKVPALLSLSWQRLAQISRAVEDCKLEGDALVAHITPLATWATEKGVTDADVKNTVNRDWIKATIGNGEASGSSAGTGSGANLQRIKKVMYDLHDDQVDLMERALAHAKEQTGQESVALNWVFILDTAMAAWSGAALPVPVKPAATVAAPAKAAAPAPTKPAAPAPAAPAKKVPAKKAVAKK